MSKAICIYEQTKNAEASWEFIKFITGKDQAGKVAARILNSRWKPLESLIKKQIRCLNHCNHNKVDCYKRPLRLATTFLRSAD